MNFGECPDPLTKPPVSVLVCIRNRPDDIVRAVDSILLSEGVGLDLVVVDQSDGPETYEALQSAIDTGKLRYVKSNARGVGAALNEGIHHAQSSFVLHIDDDCVVPPNWANGMATMLLQHTDVALLFCNVLAAPHDKNAGYIPAYEENRTRLLRRPMDTLRGRGLGAGSGFRRDAVLALGGLDGKMGPGSKFQSCEDWDLELRVLLGGGQVLHAADLEIVHYGYRSFAEGKDHTVRDWFGIGACLGKLTRARHPVALVLGIGELGRNAVLPIAVDVLHFRRPRGLRRIVAFCRGFARGIVAEVDHDTLLFL